MLAWTREAAVTAHKVFRAGRVPVPQSGRLAMPTGPAVLLADVSEFQPQIADPLYLAWSKAIIIRAAYGDQHDDRAWYGGARRDALHAVGVRFLGIYQYIVASQDPVAQAHALIRLVGKLRPGEKIIGDWEEGSGNQRARRDAWNIAIHAGLGDAPWSYSGLNFASSAGLAPVDWVAAYQSAEPSVAHKLWQFTDVFAVPGVGTADCSLFHGTIDQLAALAYQLPAPVPLVTTEARMSAITQNPHCDVVPAGTKNVVFAADPGVQGMPEIDVRVACHHSGLSWSVSTVKLTSAAPVQAVSAAGVDAVSVEIQTAGGQAGYGWA